VKDVKVYKVGDCDWIAARSAQEAMAFAEANVLDEFHGISDAVELTDEQMHRLKHCGDDGINRNNPRTFAEELAADLAEGVAVPYHFASTEY
jgi:hypothetical protein